MEQTKKRLAFIFIFFLSLQTLLGCSPKKLIPIKHPKIEFEGIEIEIISKKGVNLSLYFMVSNPNPFGITVKTIDYCLSLNGRRIECGKVKHDIKIKRLKKTRVRIPITVKKINFKDELELILKRGEISYHVSGKLFLKALFMKMKIRFDRRDRIKLS